ncbi:MAG: phosphoesterase [Planctomycetaceae bacterium]|nr:phosphoesterase [Planctomycetaceae bacterium]
MRIAIPIVWFVSTLCQVASAGKPLDDDGARFTRAQNREFQGLDHAHEGKWRKPFFFLQFADTQYGMFTGDQGLEKEVTLVAQAVRHVNRLKPRFVIVCGDLTNAIPSHPRYGAQVRQFKADFSKVSKEIPLVCVCGNHDIGNRPDPNLIGSYRKHFGDDYFGFWVGGVRCLVLNSSVIKDSTSAPQIVQRQQEWFEKMLVAAKTAQAQHIVVFQHHPWFLKTEDEPEEYFNLPVTRRRVALAAMKQSGVRAIFAGHYHRNSYGQAGTIAMITSGPVGRPLGKDPSGFRVVKVFRDRLEHKYYSLDQVPATIPLTGQQGNGRTKPENNAPDEAHAQGSPQPTFATPGSPPAVVSSRRGAEGGGGDARQSITSVGLLPPKFREP